MIAPSSTSLSNRALTLLDLTNLNDDCTEKDIEALCTMATTRFGSVAAICIWARFIPQAKQLLAGKDIKIASVANFPAGGVETLAVVDEAVAMVADGADEVDLVMPYAAYLSGRRGFAETQIVRVKEAITGKAALKVIIEAGELKDPEIIRAVSEMAIGAGADFIKTSTGKVPVSATPESAEIMIGSIAAMKKPVGFKAAGGIRTAADAALYLDIAARIMGPDWATPDTFRFGASGLLNALLADLEGAQEPENDSSY